MIKDDGALAKYNEIWDNIKDLIGKKLHRKPAHDDKYINTKVRLFEGMVHAYF